MKGIIYKATNIINGKCYIGQTTKDLTINPDTDGNIVKYEDIEGAFNA